MQGRVYADAILSTFYNNRQGRELGRQAQGIHHELPEYLPQKRVLTPGCGNLQSLSYIIGYMAKRKFYKQKNRLRRDFRPAESRNLKGDSGKHGNESQKVKQTLLHIYCDEILLLENFVVIYTSFKTW